MLEPLLIEHAGAIERVVTAAAAVGGVRTEVQQGHAVITRLESDLALSVARLAPGREVRQVLEAVPAAADRLALDEHLAQVSRLSDRLEQYRERAAVLDAAVHTDREVIAPPGDPAARQRLTLPFEARSRWAMWSAGRVRANVSSANWSRCWNGRWLMSVSPPIERCGPLSRSWMRRLPRRGKELADVDAAISTLQEEQKLLERDLDGQRLRLRQLAAEGEVVTAETLRQARARRDDGWMSIRRAYIDQVRDRDQLPLGFDATRVAPEAFEPRWVRRIGRPICCEPTRNVPPALKNARGASS